LRIKTLKASPELPLKEILSLVRELTGTRISSDARIPDLAKVDNALDKVWEQRAN
jgi:hypothetical protein